MSKPNAANPAVRDFAEGFGVQAKLSNRLWISLFAVLAVIILPDLQSDPLERSSMKLLPFGFGEVEEKLFDLLAFFLLCVLIVSYCSARAGAMIAYDLAHRAIDHISQEQDEIVMQRQYFDMLSFPTLLRVGPISVIAKRRLGSGPFVRAFSTGLYATMKYAAVLITFGIPLYAIYASLSKIVYSTEIGLLVQVVASAFGLIATLATLQLLIADLRLTGGVLRRLFGG